MKTASWEDFGVTANKALSDLQKYIEQNNTTIDVVVPILRGGNFLGSYLAYKLNILRILPVQYKYFFNKKNKAELRQLLFTVDKDLLPQNPTVLIVEGDYCYGTTAKQACMDVKSAIPDAKILLAADLMDYSYKNAVDEYAEATFYGRYTNHCEELSAEQCRELGIEDFGVAPWENIDEEKAVMSLKQFPYIDLESAINKSDHKLEIDLSDLQEKWDAKTDEN